MQVRQIDGGSEYVLSDASGVQQQELGIRRKWVFLPEEFGSVAGPQYRITQRLFNTTLDIDLSDRQMIELFHAWMVLRQGYEEDNPKLVERDLRQEKRKRRLR